MRSFGTLLLCSLILLSEFSSCQDYICISPEESLKGIRGRLWVNPNPIRFPPQESKSEETVLYVTLANIGSELVDIDYISVVGNPDFHFSSGLEDTLETLTYPFGMGGIEGCDRYQRIGLPLYYTGTDGNQSKGFLRVQTSDITSQTLEVPIYLDTEARIPEEQDYPVGLLPLVKPNPIRFQKTIEFGEKQTLEVCLRLDNGDQYSKLTRLETYGKDFYLQKITDQDGNEIPLPITGYTIGQDTILLQIVNEPVPSGGEGGTLQVEFVDDLGDDRTLLVPILTDYM